ncbi:putative potassium channel [Phaeomoniella chlamydospora]|uniref:Putative potassium channel n=1 Tax=Phaeomoniella chlamydospora TaxID=158046 RepID=A0A0G2F025_PHACM|nr:putative potassium channel [Phaeomoniella chlamydospora]
MPQDVDHREPASRDIDPGKDHEEDESASQDEEASNGARGDFTIGKFHFRGEEDDGPNDWWFLSKAVPLIAACAGPLANVMSVAALVTSWRADIIESTTESSFENTAIGFPDPHWCIALNIASLVCGFIGNLFLLFNFTKAVRYIIALPMTILLWYFATGLLMGGTIAMNKHVPPEPNQIYSQGFWHAVIAACLYMFCSMILMLNLLGYILGHYPQHFALTDDQRNLILQSIMFFIWLAGGAGVFVRTNDMSYANSLYFCDVTILTVGFGDFHPNNDVSRGIIFPYSVGGIIILGLLVSSIHKFARELSQDNVIRTHMDRVRQNTLSRAITPTTDDEMAEKSIRRLDLRPGHRPTISSPMEGRQMYDGRWRSKSVTSDHGNQSNTRGIQFSDHPRLEDNADRDPTDKHFLKHRSHGNAKYFTKRILSAPVRAMTFPVKQISKSRNERSKLLIMKEEKDRFEAIRKVQRKASAFQRYFALSISVIAFAILWCVGAVGFWKAEKRTQHLSYFEALYFCYVSLLTIGYGDLSPQSNAGKPFFIVWSLIAVPTMTILVSDMGDTVIDSFKRGTFKLADWTVLPRKGIYTAFVKRNPWLYDWIQKKAENKKIKKGFGVGPDDRGAIPTIDELAQIESSSEAELTRQLAFAIRRVADDLKSNDNKKYNYEEWVEFTRLIRFTKTDYKGLEIDEDEYGVVEWDWIGDDSPMLSDQSETEWVLDRLCESLLRLLKRDILTVRPNIEADARGTIQEQTRKRDDIDISSNENDGKDSHDEPLWRSIDDVVDAPEQRLSTSTRHEGDGQFLDEGIDPRHRAIGLFPEMESATHHADRARNQVRLSYDMRTPSGLSRSRLSSDDSEYSARGRRRRSSGVASSAANAEVARSPMKRKGPFRNLSSARSTFLSSESAEGGSGFRNRLTGRLHK